MIGCGLNPILQQQEHNVHREYSMETPTNKYSYDSTLPNFITSHFFPANLSVARTSSLVCSSSPAEWPERPQTTNSASGKAWERIKNASKFFQNFRNSTIKYNLTDLREIKCRFKRTDHIVAAVCEKSWNVAYFIDRLKNMVRSG